MCDFKLSLINMKPLFKCTFIKTAFWKQTIMFTSILHMWKQLCPRGMLLNAGSTTPVMTVSLFLFFSMTPVKMIAFFTTSWFI